jgi:SpoVK/Ycf46/Vps4 family AAA+-type ATPase
MSRLICYLPPFSPQTQLARAIAGEAKAAFLSIAPSDILGQPIGELETSIQSIFKQAQTCATQLESKCAVIFPDHIDTYGSREYLAKEDACRSRRVLAELSIQLDNIISQNRSTTAGPHVLVVAATSCSHKDCDPALLRRFGARLHVGLPCYDDRKEIIKRYLQDIDNDLVQDDDDDLLDMAASLDGWSGSDLKNLTREATMIPVREHLRGARLQGDQVLLTGRPIPKVRRVTLADFGTAYNSFKFVV